MNEQPHLHYAVSTAPRKLTPWQRFVVRVQLGTLVQRAVRWLTKGARS